MSPLLSIVRFGTRRRAHKLVVGALLVAALLATVTTPASARGSTQYIASFATPDGRFRAVIDDPDSVARLGEAVAARDLSLVGIPNGVVVRGSGGINHGHAWHLEEVTLVDLTIEVCDGTAQYVDDHLDEWLRDVGRYCPWGARLVSFRRR